MSYDSLESANEALITACRAVLNGSKVRPRGLATREIVNWGFVLENPRARRITVQARDWSEPYAVGELAWHFSGSNDLEEISYYSLVWRRFSEDGSTIRGSCYGNAIFHEGSQGSQWERAKQVLKEDPETRRAVLTLCDPQAILKTSRDIPCFTTLQFLYRDRRLHCIGSMRSNDVIWGLSYDLYFATMLQERMALELGLELGSYTHVVTSLHVYDEFLNMAEDIAASDVDHSRGMMSEMTSPAYIPLFLNVERLMRGDDIRAINQLERLDEYWRTLANPLLRLAAKRHGTHWADV